MRYISGPFKALIGGEHGGDELPVVDLKFSSRLPVAVAAAPVAVAVAPAAVAVAVAPAPVAVAVAPRAVPIDRRHQVKLTLSSDQNMAIFLAARDTYNSTNRSSSNHCTSATAQCHFELSCDTLLSAAALSQSC